MFPYILQALYMPKDRPLDSTPERSSGDMHTKQKTRASNLGIGRRAPFGRRRISHLKLEGGYPGNGTPCFGAGIDLLNFLHMRAGLKVKPVHSLVFMRIDQEPERLTITKGFVTTKRS